MFRNRLHYFLFLSVSGLIFSMTPAFAATAENEAGRVLWLLLFGGAALSATGAVVGKASMAQTRRNALEAEVAKIGLQNVSEDQDADLTVFAPDYGTSGQTILVQAIVHLMPHQERARDIAVSNDADTKMLGSTPLAIGLARNDLIKLTLESQSAAIAEPVQSLHWNGRLVNFIFDIQMPIVTQSSIERFNLRATVNGVPVGRVIFKIKVGLERLSRPNIAIDQEKHAYRRTFLSYASSDRSQVLRAAQLIKALKMDCFQDILSLEPGDAWRKRLFSEIDQCDVFLLFWSNNARQSKWVIEEAEYALKLRERKTHRPLEIVPVLLEGPPAIPPPNSLSEIHFNDSLRHIIFAEETAAAKARLDHRNGFYRRVILGLGGGIIIAAILYLEWKYF